VTSNWTRLARALAVGCLTLMVSGQDLPGSGASSDGRRLEISVELRKGGSWIEADPATVFDSGAELRFRARTNFPAHLFVTNAGTSGTSAVIYPSAEAGRQNLLQPGRELVLPASDGAFRISGPAGYDVLYWIATPWNAARAEGQPYVPLPAPPKPGTMQHTLVPRCDDAIFRAHGECKDLSAGSRRVQPGSPMTDNGKQSGDLRARDIEFVRRAPTEAVVIYEMRIAHR